MQSSTRNKIIGVVVAVVVAIVVAVGVRFAIGGLSGAGQSPSDTASQAVAELKKSTTLPQQVDEVTTLEDVTAEGDTVHYHYTISGADTSAITDESLKGVILKPLCDTAETKKLLDADVKMEYSYEVAENGDTHDLTFSKADC